MPDRLTGVCITNSASALFALPEVSLDEEDMKAVNLIERVGTAQATTALAEQDAELAHRLEREPLSILDDASPGDRWLLEPPAAAIMAENIREGVRQGAVGWSADSVALLTPWGFALGDISIPVSIWFGSKDPSVDEGAVRRLAGTIPKATLTVWPDEGHARFLKHFDELITAACGDEAA